MSFTSRYPRLRVISPPSPTPPPLSFDKAAARPFESPPRVMDALGARLSALGQSRANKRTDRSWDGGRREEKKKSVLSADGPCGVGR
ncbi:hypothetical protein EYF80_052801 [Liparis tanakae]|uniref:Uncharacterized protein n=1 Tax=Liparis tanakae TaxID=230148 RepID=A0A4Z2F894_9TELE|nr:hypothetical protein EYF80_052801 [Liparis tanakae]